MFVRCTVYEIWFNSLCRFCVNRTFCYVVWVSNQKLNEQSVCSRLACLYYLSQYKRDILVCLVEPTVTRFNYDTIICGLVFQYKSNSLWKLNSFWANTPPFSCDCPSKNWSEFEFDQSEGSKFELIFWRMITKERWHINSEAL